MIPKLLRPAILGAMSLSVMSLGAMSFSLVAQEVAETGRSFGETVQPIVRSHCSSCHGPQKQEGDFRFDTLASDLKADPKVAEQWHRVLKVLEKGEMPPEGAKPLRSGKRKKFIDAIAREVEDAIQKLDKKGTHCVPRRLNRVEYANTMRDLLGLDMDYGRDLPNDPPSQDGFYNNGQSLPMSAEQLQCYLDTARRAMDKVIVSGPAPKVFQHEFKSSNVGGWKGDVELSNRLGRRQEFIAKMVGDYPEEGEFLIRVKLSANLKQDIGFPLLEVSLGYRPDTEILFGEVALIEIAEPAIQDADATPDKNKEEGEGHHEPLEQVFELRGRVENFPLPVRGQGKFPGLVIKIRNAYDDGSPLPKGKKEKENGNKWIYPEELDLPTMQIHSVKFEGPIFDQWPPQMHRQILFDSEQRNTDEKTYVAEVLHRFMTRAYRQPVEPSEVDRLLEFFLAIRPEFPTFEEAIRETLSMVLISPRFLYLMVPSDKESGIDDSALAARLSYFLWSTIPDTELNELATHGRLHDSDRMAQHVERMLKDDRSIRFVEQFTDQWLNIDKLENVSVSQERFKGFDDRIKKEMRRETQQYFKYLLDHDLSAMNLLRSDFVVINEKMAKHYGIGGVWGASYRRVEVEPTLHRGGLLGQASLLLSNSTGRDSHPVRRAVWIRDRLLNDPPSPPPADVPPLKEADPNFGQLSVREQLEIHRSTDSCARCHRGLDPWGIALENFDAVGRWRSESIDATAIFPGDRKVEGFEQLREYLVAEHASQFAGSLVSRLLTYALGRKLELSDQPTVNRLTTEFAADGYRLKSLIQNVVKTSAFQNSGTGG